MILLAALSKGSFPAYFTPLWADQSFRGPPHTLEGLKYENMDLHHLSGKC